MGLLVIKRGKIVKMEGILLQDGQEVKGFDDSGYKYIGILETDQLKEKETKDLFAEEKDKDKAEWEEKNYGSQHMVSSNSKVQRWCGRMEE